MPVPLTGPSSSSTSQNLQRSALWGSLLHDEATSRWARVEESVELRGKRAVRAGAVDGSIVVLDIPEPA